MSNAFVSIKKILPWKIKSYLKDMLNRTVKELKQPKMIWGYRDSNGEWRSKTRISDTVFIYHPERIIIHDNVFIWHYTILDGVGGLEIQEGAQIGAWVGIFTHSSHKAIRLYGKHYQEVNEQDKKVYPILSVTIGKYSFVGAGAKIFPGVCIGKGVIVSAGSMVTKSVPDYKIVAGSPAEIIGDTRKTDFKYLEEDPKLKRWYEEWTLEE